MDVEALVKEIRYGAPIETAVSQMSENPKAIRELMDLVFSYPAYPVAEYGSWLMSHITKHSTKNIARHHRRLIDELLVCNHPTVLRNLLFCLNELPHLAYKEGEVADRLLEFIQDGTQKVAVQVYAIYLLLPFIARYPELKPEIVDVIALNAEGKTPAYKVAQRKFMVAVGETKAD